MIDELSTADKAVAGAAGAGLLAWLIRLFAHRISHDMVDKAKHQGEVDLIKVLQQENHDLRISEKLASEERNQAVQQVGALKKEVEMLREHIERLENTVEELRSQVEKLLSRD